MGQTMRMFALFKETAVLAFKRAAAAWPVALSLVFYALVFVLASRVVAGLGLGMVGGFILGLVAAACVSGYLYFLSQAVAGTKLSLRDLKHGFGALFWDVISVMFAVWVISLAAEILSRGAGPNSMAVAAVVSLAMAFFFNPVPELIYLGSTRSFQLLMTSARFVLANPVAWFLPNLLLAAILLFPTGALSVEHPGYLLVVFSQLFSEGGLLAVFQALPAWAWAPMLLLVHYGMVFRGLLFQALSNYNPRRRQWQASVRS